MLDINEIISHCTAYIDKARFATKPGVIDKINMINRLGREIGIEQMSTDHPDAFEYLRDYLDGRLSKIFESKMNSDLKLIEEALQSALNESGAISLPQPVNMLRYEDDDVVKIIKQLCKKEFSKFKLTKITGDEGGGFYSMEVQSEVSDMDKEIELKRFELAKLMADFRAEFFAAISKVLPIVNIKTTPYQFTKNSNKVKFGLIMALSNTNDREWVTGAYKRPDEAAKQKLIDAQTKDDLKEGKLIKQDFSVPKGVEVFDVVDRLNDIGIKASVRDNNSFTAKWQANRFSPEEIQHIANDPSALSEVVTLAKTGKIYENATSPQQVATKVANQYGLAMIGADIQNIIAGFQSSKGFGGKNGVLSGRMVNGVLKITIGTDNKKTVQNAAWEMSEPFGGRPSDQNGLVYLDQSGAAKTAGFDSNPPEGTKFFYYSTIDLRPPQQH